MPSERTAEREAELRAARARLVRAVNTTRTGLEGQIGLVARGFKLGRITLPLIALGVGFVVARRLRSARRRKLQG